MTERIIVSAAGNTLAPALAVARALGYEVTRELTGLRRYKAVNPRCELFAEDPLLLLGLIQLFESRGAFWHPSDAEISAFLALEEQSNG
ncbi:hypothetical protein [Duganella sp. CF458]|uniref:hypothetical protein n=1 Tax=Duganella sp. CF458 TaxID=1884368 RepID=UPI001479F674|nr:hypothetical protein [Duganella sp. CF458]